MLSQNYDSTHIGHYYEPIMQISVSVFCIAPVLCSVHGDPINFKLQ